MPDKAIKSRRSAGEPLDPNRDLDFLYRLGETIASGGNLMMGLMPSLITLGTFMLLFVFLNKAFCGWICPTGRTWRQRCLPIASPAPRTATRRGGSPSA